MSTVKELFLEEGFAVEISIAEKTSLTRTVYDSKVSILEVRIQFEDRTPDIVGRCEVERRYGRLHFPRLWWETRKDTADSPWVAVVRNRKGKGGISFGRGSQAARRWTDFSRDVLKDIGDLIITAFEE